MQIKLHRLLIISSFCVLPFCINSIKTWNKHLLITNVSQVYSADQISRSVVSDSLQLHESQHARPPCPSRTPRVHSHLRPSSQWCHPAISSSVVPFSSCPQSLPAWVFSNESTLHMRWPKYWSFSFSIIIIIAQKLMKYPTMIWKMYKVLFLI